MCGCIWALHWGHVVSVVAVVFQFARRERVLERDVFRFGTATSVLSLCVGGRRRRGGTETLQRRPPGVDDVVMVVRVVCEPRPALGAQTRAVLPAHRLERQC